MLIAIWTFFVGWVAFFLGWGFAKQNYKDPSEIEDVSWNTRVLGGAPPRTVCSECGMPKPSTYLEAKCSNCGSAEFRFIQ